MINKQYYIYILTNTRHSVFYTGVTNNLVRRIYEHKHKLVKGFTEKYNLDQLIYYEVTDSPLSAIEREKQIKDYRRSKKLDLIIRQNPAQNDLYDSITSN